MIVSHSRQVIFVANPKSGSRSIEAALAGLNDEPELDCKARDGFYTGHHIPAVELREALGRSIWDSYFKFAIVRNPWDWFISQHFYNLQKHATPHDIRALITPADVLKTEQFLRVYRGCEWARTACQHAFVCDELGTVLVDYLGKYENLRKDFQILSSAIGARPSLPHMNASVHSHYRKYYSTDTRQLVRQLYARDIELFDYEF